MTEESLRATGAVISLFLAGFTSLGALLMIGHPNFSLWGWLGVAVMGVLAVVFWESTKKIGTKP